MNNIAKLPIKDRDALFRNTAHNMGMSEAIIEKDFWVCFILDYLFNKCKWKNNLAFKGGTSLSKSFGLIERFSEDIDLILDWCILSYGKDEPWNERTFSKQDLFNKDANIRAVEFLKNEFVPAITKDIENELNIEIHFYTDIEDEQTINFAYPNSFTDKSITPEIRLEIGALAAWTPAAIKQITPYAAVEYTHLFSKPTTEVLTVLPERTFWEKITILHREANRPKDKEFPARYSRHYYDLYCIANSDIKAKAISDKELLTKVVVFKEKFYRCPWAKYDEAKVGTIKLLPPLYNLAELEDDYKHMQNMIFGNKPTFTEMMKVIEQLERDINAL
jgi:hypothetical protein